MIACIVVRRIPSHGALGRIPSVIARRPLSRSPQSSFSRNSQQNLAQSPLNSRRRPPRKRFSRGSSHSPLVDKSTLPHPNQSHSVAKCPSLEGTPKYVRRGHGFNHHYSYARHYHTTSPDCSPARSHCLSGRNIPERDKFVCIHKSSLNCQSWKEFLTK